MKANSHDITTALTIIVQATIVGLMESGAISVEQGQRIFDGALKKAKKASPEVVEIVQHVYDNLDWDKLFAASAARKKPR